MIRLAILIAACFCCISSVSAAEGEEIDNEILRIKKELAQVRQEREKTREDALKDKKDFAEYAQRFAARKASLAGETDSILRAGRVLEASADSLAALTSSLDIQKKQYELLQERFRDRLLAACGRLIFPAKKFPPAISKQSLGALSFLLSDCKTKKVDNVEALRRLVQIAQNMEEYSLSIQTGQETSPAPSIRGSALMLRIGTVFEAVVDEDGKTGALWIGNDTSGQPQWSPFTEATNCAAVFKAISIRDSKALPEFITLPYTLARRTEVKR